MIRLAQGPVATVPIIGLTADATPAQHQECLAAGMDRVVLKPVDCPQLWSVMADVLREREAGPPGSGTPSIGPPASLG
ncbi:MAG: hybrid sensor histidine kinase/response regulator, partial [Alphaproteobacteria bacterium]|nr:hybrid sensor histidine kinase/response regulator [Alphaproteobacteria bacterium]